MRSVVLKNKSVQTESTDASKSYLSSKEMYFFPLIWTNRTCVFDFLTGSPIMRHRPVKAGATLFWTQANKVKVTRKHMVEPF